MNVIDLEHIWHPLNKSATTGCHVTSVIRLVTFTFIWCFYPKRLTVHSGYTFTFFFQQCVPWELNPLPFLLLTQWSTTEPQEHGSIWISGSFILILINLCIFNHTVCLLTYKCCKMYSVFLPNSNRYFSTVNSQLKSYLFLESVHTGQAFI